jgi:hypothetical protein
MAVTIDSERGSERGVPSENPVRRPLKGVRRLPPTARHVWINRRDARLGQCSGMTPTTYHVSLVF